MILLAKTMHLYINTFITYQQLLNSSATLSLNIRLLITQGKFVLNHVWSKLSNVRRLFSLVGSNKKNPWGKKFENYCYQNNDEYLHYLSLDKLRSDLCPHFVLISHKHFWNINKTASNSYNNLISYSLKGTLYTFII